MTFIAYTCTFRTLVALAVLCCSLGNAMAVSASVDWSTVAYTDRSNYPVGLAPDHQGNLYFGGFTTPPANSSTYSFFLGGLLLKN